MVHVVMLSGFTQKSQFPTDRRGVRHVALVIHARVRLVNLLRSFDFGIPSKY